jgi:hypothetical protein
MKTYWGVEIHAFLTSALCGGEWSTSRSGRFTLEKKASNTHWIESADLPECWKITELRVIPEQGGMVICLGSLANAIFEIKKLGGETFEEWQGFGRRTQLWTVRKKLQLIHRSHCGGKFKCCAYLKLKLAVPSVYFETSSSDCNTRACVKFVCRIGSCSNHQWTP